MVSPLRYAPLVFVALLAILSAGVIAPAAKVTYGGGARLVLEVDGQVVPIESVSGCRPVATIVSAQAQDGTTKHVGGLAFEPCTVTLAAAPTPGLAKWMQDTLQGTAPRKAFALHQVDLDRKITQTTTGSDALLTAIAFPTFDAMSRNVGTLKLEISAEALASSKGSGQSVNLPAGKSASKALDSNFQVALDNVSLPGVARVEGLVVRAPLAPPAAGALRETKQASPGLDVGDVTLVLATAKAAPLAQWADDFLVKGDNAADKERTLQVTALAANMKDPLYVVTLRGVGVFAGDLYFPQGTAEGNAVPRSTFVVYAEKATFQPHASWS